MHDPQRKNEVKTTKLNYNFLITDFWHGFSGMQFVFISKKKKKKFSHPKFIESISQLTSVHFQPPTPVDHPSAAEYSLDTENPHPVRGCSIQMDHRRSAQAIVPDIT